MTAAATSQFGAYLFAGGGTGGHLTPGFAVAAELQKEHPCRVLFIGSGRPIEMQLVSAAGYEHAALNVEPVQSLQRRPLRFALQTWRAYRQAKALVRAESPRAVIGLGGWASVPIVLAAARSRTPTILLEQNRVPGRANLWLGRRADAICISFDGSRTYFRAECRTFETGNPVRPEIAALVGAAEIQRSHERDVLLILGGSQGAEGLNDAVRRLFSSAPERWRGLRVVHQSGLAQCELLRARYAGLGLDCIVEPFFSDVAALYRQATLVVARAGATTLAELACAGCPAVLVPYPHAADDHQFHNAEHYRLAGAARIVRELSDPAEAAHVLGECVADLLGDRQRLQAMRRAMRSLARPDAAREVVRVLQDLVSSEW